MAKVSAQLQTWELGSKHNERPTILVTTVELGPGVSGTITLYEGDDPRDAAQRFCLEHSLPSNVVEPLTLHILENLENMEHEIDTTPELSQADDVHAAIPRPPNTVPAPQNNHTKPRGPSLVREAEETAAEVEATLASYTTTGTAATTTTAPPPLVRPSSATSSLATEYYGRPLHSASTAARTAEATAAPAADRLYADHFRKQAMLDEQRRIRDLELQLATQEVYCTPVSRALAAHRTAGGYSSYGERLYEEGRLEALRREAEMAHIRAQEAEAELQGATFHPQISKLAQNLKYSSAAASAAAAAARGGSAGSTSWERLHNQGSAMKKERRAEAIRKELEEEELKECSFKPRVDRNSARLVQERRGVSNADHGLPLYQRLYNEGLFTKEKKEEHALMWLPDDATFKPKVNTSSVVMTDLVAAAEGDITGALARDVSERLLLRGKRYQEKLEAARQASTAPVDADGCPLFQPKTLRAPRGVERSGPIGQHLYSAALKSSAKAEAQAEAARKQAVQQASSVHVNTVSIKMMERLQRERLTAIFAYLTRVGPSEMIPMEINLFHVLQDEEFMDTIDPEVRADVEHAGRLLRKTILSAQQQQRELGQQEQIAEDGVVDDAFATVEDVGEEFLNENGSAWVVKVPISLGGAGAGALSRGSSAGGAPLSTTSSILGCSAEREALWATSKHGEISEAGFIALMSEVLDRTRGIARQYLLPLPSTRRKWEEPTFKPAIEPRSLALAARTRPDGLPAHEILYRTAQETAEKKEMARREKEAAILRECSFQPTFVAAQVAGVNQGRALKMASQPPVIKHNLTKQEIEARREDEELVALAAEIEQRKQVQILQSQQKRGTAARGSSGGAPGQYNSGAMAPGDGFNKVIHLSPLENLGTTTTTANPPPLPPSGTFNNLHLNNNNKVTASISSNALEDGIDAIERQIQDAMARLNVYAVDVAASSTAFINPLSEKQGQVAPQQPQQPSPLNNADELAARLRASLDYDALFGLGPPAAGNSMSDAAFSITGDNSAAVGEKLVEEFSEYNPMQDGQTPANNNNYNNDVAVAVGGSGAASVAGGNRSLLAQLAAEPLPADLVECTGSSC